MKRCHLLLALFLLFPLRLVADEEEDALLRLTDDVAENEAHYQDCALVLSSTYWVADWVFAKADANDLVGSLRIISQISIIQKDQHFRSRDTGTSLTLGGVDISDNVDVFDGRIHQSFRKNTGIEIGTGHILRSESWGGMEEHSPVLTNLSRPHMLLLEMGAPNVPLSIYMQGAKAVLAYPNPGYFPKGKELRLSDLGSAEFQGLDCRRILIEVLSGNGRPSHRRDVWLAVDRNFIPVRKVAYTYRISKVIPGSESIVDEWQEIRPGVWFPVKAHTIAYDSDAIKRQGKQVPRWEKEYSVDSISLEPLTTAETFTKLDFPLGTEVERIE